MVYNNTTNDFNNLVINTEQSLNNNYNIFLIEYINTTHQIFENILLNEDDVKLIGKDDSLNKEYAKKAKEEKREEFKKNFSEKKEKFKEMITKWAEEAWKKIKKFFADMVQKVKDIYNEIKKKYGSSMAEKFTKALKNIKDEKFTIEAYSRNFIAQLNTESTSFGKAIIAYMNGADNFFKKQNPDIDEFDKKYSTEGLLKSVFGQDKDIKMEDLKAPGKFTALLLRTIYRIDYQSIIRNEISKDYLKKEFSESFDLNTLEKEKNYIFNVAFNNNGWMNALKKNYDIAKKFMVSCKDGAIKSLANEEYNADLLKKYISSCNDCIKIIIYLANVANLNYDSIRINYLDVINRVIAAGKAAEKG